MKLNLILTKYFPFVAPPKVSNENTVSKIEQGSIIQSGIVRIRKKLYNSRFNIFIQ